MSSANCGHDYCEAEDAASKTFPTRKTWTPYYHHRYLCNIFIGRCRLTMDGAGAAVRLLPSDMQLLDIEALLIQGARSDYYRSTCNLHPSPLMRKSTITRKGKVVHLFLLRQLCFLDCALRWMTSIVTAVGRKRFHWIVWNLLCRWIAFWKGPDGCHRGRRSGS